MQHVMAERNQENQQNKKQLEDSIIENVRNRFRLKIN